MTKTELKEFLDEKVFLYDKEYFIMTDPIQVPYSFSEKEDIEIMAFLVATIAWGQRKTIIANGFRLAEALGNRPLDFLLNASEEDFENIEPFVHRTFSHIDLLYFLKALKNIYKDHGGLESSFAIGDTQKERIINFRNLFLSFDPLDRTHKHVSNPEKGSSAKRLNMFMRWMVRDGQLDFGLWKSIPKSELLIPLDVHTASVGRSLGLLKRKQNDWKAVEELSSQLSAFDKEDPIKYDLALFGLGAFEAFTKN